MNTFKCECGNDEFAANNPRNTLGYDKQVIECTKCGREYKLPTVVTVRLNDK